MTKSKKNQKQIDVQEAVKIIENANKEKRTTAVREINTVLKKHNLKFQVSGQIVAAGNGLYGVAASISLSDGYAEIKLQ